MNNDVFINNGNQEYLINEDEEESESIVYYEYGAHFKYKDLFDNLLKIKKERERSNHNENMENQNNNLVNNNIFINNNLNLNLFNNNKHKIISRNLQVNNYINNDNILENSNTFISNLSKEQLNKTALLPSSEIIQQKINEYLEKNKLLINSKNKNGNNFIKSNKIIEINKLQKDKNKISNNKDKLKRNIKQRNIDNKENINLNSNKTQKSNKSQEKNAINLKKRKNKMITLSFKYNKESNINNIIFKKLKDSSNNRNYGNWTKQLIEKMTKTKAKTKSKSKSKSNSKNTNKKVSKKTNNIKIYNKIKKFTEKNSAFVSHNHFNKKNRKDISHNYTTKIMNKYKRTNKFLITCNFIDSRKAHSSSISKNEKYNLNSLIHNTQVFNLMKEKRKKSPNNNLNQISKPNIDAKKFNNILTLNNAIKNKNKLKTKNQLLRNSINIYSIGVSVARTKDSNVNSEINFSKSNSKNKKLKSNKNMKMNQINNKYHFNNKIISQERKNLKPKQKSDKKILKKIKAASPFNNLYNPKGLKKQDSNNIGNKLNKKIHYWNNKEKKNSMQDNKSLDSQKLIGKKNKSKVSDSSTSANKNIVTKNKNKILSRNIGGNNINNYLIKNYTNAKLNTKEIFNYKLNNLTITNLNKIKEQINRNVFNNLNSFSNKTKKNNIMNNTNSFLNNHDYLKLLNTLNKSKGTYLTNNYSDYLKKRIVLNGSKSKNNICLKNNFFNKPVKKLNKKKK